MQKLGTVLKKRAPANRSRQTERGDLLDEFLRRLNPSRTEKGLRPLTYRRLAYLLTGIPTGDLYALRSKCDDAERRGYAWGAIFYKEIKPQDA
jgi:hypothetical protein